ncbi:MAG: DUF1289 domain-containing protein [Caulobacterales bacterium]|nr:DUF1289 domain-containing protein [Caulobacterales bacterium]
MRTPCVDLCAFDGKTGWCLGCGRSRDEIRSWKKAQPNQLRKIENDLPRRLLKLKGKGPADKPGS